jgi:hypothetical protein
MRVTWRIKQMTPVRILPRRIKDRKGKNIAISVIYFTNLSEIYLLTRWWGFEPLQKKQTNTILFVLLIFLEPFFIF